MYPQEYKCTECGAITKHYVWISELETAKHECGCGEILTPENVYYKSTVEPPSHLRKMTKDQIKADRQKRSTDHFKREIIPTLSGKDQRYFKNKYKNDKK